MNSLRMICRTFMDWLAHSMRFFPRSAKSRFFTSQLTCVVVVDIPLLLIMTARLRMPRQSVEHQDTRTRGTVFPGKRGREVTAGTRRGVPVCEKVSVLRLAKRARAGRHH